LETKRNFFFIISPEIYNRETNILFQDQTL